MTNPDVNTSEQARRHRPSLIAIAIAVTFAAVLFLWFLFVAVDPENDGLNDADATIGAEPATTEPATTEPVTTEPATTEPSTTEPTDVEPVVPEETN